MIFFCCSWMFWMVRPSLISRWHLLISASNWSFSDVCWIFNSSNCLHIRVLSRSNWTLRCRTVIQNWWKYNLSSISGNREVIDIYLHYSSLAMPQFSLSTIYSPPAMWKHPNQPDPRHRTDLLCFCSYSCASVDGRCSSALECHSFAVVTPFFCLLLFNIFQSMAQWLLQRINNINE